MHECDESGLSAHEVKHCSEACEAGRCTFQGDPYCGRRTPSEPCRFWALDLDNYERPCSLGCGGFPPGGCTDGVCDHPNANLHPYGVAIANPGAEVLTVSVSTPSGPTYSATIPAGESTFLQLQDLTVGDTRLSQRAYHVETTNPATVFQFNPASFPPTTSGETAIESGDASLLLPMAALGTHYLIPGWPAADGDEPLRPYFTIVGVEDDTAIEVRTPVGTLAGGGVPVLSPGIPRAFQLDAGDVLQIMADDTRDGDLTGSEIEATKPIMVMSGHECASIPTGVDSCDHLESQLHPTSLWGSSYVGLKLERPGTEPDIFRVMAVSNDTVLSTTPTIPAVDGAVLQAGEFLEFATSANFVITATDAVQLAQFAVGGGHRDIVATRGDPSLLIPPPIDRFNSRYLVHVPDGYETNVAHLALRPQTRIWLDDEPLTDPRQPIPASDWETLTVAITPGTHVFDGSDDFGLTMYGESEWVSYAYPGGLDLR